MSAPDAQEFSGKSVDEAIAEGLRKLGLTSDQAVVEIVQKGSRGLFGLGSEPAIVRIATRSEMPAPQAESMAEAAGITAQLPAEHIAESSTDTEAPPLPTVTTSPRPTAQTESADGEGTDSEGTDSEGTDGKGTDNHAHAGAVSAREPAPPPAGLPTEAAEQDAEVAHLATEMLSNVIRLMGFDGTVQAEWRDADDITEDRHMLLSVHGQDISALIGRRGETLENLQYLLRLMVNQRMHRWLNIIVDVEDYRSKRVDHLTHLAQRMADQVADTGRAFALEPMPPNERRIVHLALRDDTRIFTESTGDGERRKVNIFPRN